jgi:Asp-tRNA(Asn)/Glu-tRNA(Gln) amidotransferase A subunit family amidase
MPKSRRHFLTTSLGLMGAAAASRAAAQTTTQLPPGAPPAFGAGPAVGPEVSATTFAEAEKLVQVALSKPERSQAAGSWRQNMAAVYERRTGPRKVALAPAVAPATLWNPALPGLHVGPARNQFIRSKADPGPLPGNDEDIAFAPVTKLSRWIERRQITSERLTRLYLKRLEQFNPELRCVITLTRDLALAQAKQADTEIAAGKYRGPLHGIPWGAKDLLDTAGIPTTYGAEPYRNRVPADDAVVVKRLHQSGAVLVAKLSLGALALNDIWFGGQTMNPWLLEEGSSGSSAGPGAATAAGLVGFAIGSETGGSIIGPSMRCGITGLRPTYGRVARTGAMTLCWSLDKLGPMTRSVEDALLVLPAISGPDAGDLESVPSKLDFDAQAPVKGLRVGYFPKWMSEAPATDVDRAALETVKKVGMVPVEVSIPDWPYDCLDLILFAEGAAAFEELTLSGGLSSKCKCRTHGRTSSANRGSSPPWISCRRIASAAKSPKRWPGSSPRWTYCSCRRCVTRC